MIQRSVNLSDKCEKGFSQLPFSAAYSSACDCLIPETNFFTMNWASSIDSRAILYKRTVPIGSYLITLDRQIIGSDPERCLQFLGTLNVSDQKVWGE